MKMNWLKYLERIKAGLAAERLPHRTKQVLMTMQDVRKSEIAEKAWIGGAAVEVGLWGSLQRQHQLNTIDAASANLSNLQ